MNIGLKYDDGKDPWHLLPLHVIRGIVKVLQHGAKKYGPNNWQNLVNAEDRYFSAAMRHLEAYRRGEYYDEDSGLPHLDHALCSLMFIRHLDAPKENSNE
jgi:hypothetical protein